MYLPQGFNVEVPPLYAVCCVYAQDVQMELKHMLPLNGPGTDYWTLRGTLRVAWASSSSTPAEPQGNQQVLDAINSVIEQQFSLPKGKAHIEWREEGGATKEEPCCLYFKMSVEFCKRFIR